MTDWVRARVPAGHEVTVSREYAKANKLEPVDKPAVDVNGRPLPMKPRINTRKPDAPANDSPATEPAKQEATK